MKHKINEEKRNDAATDAALEEMWTPTNNQGETTMNGENDEIKIWKNKITEAEPYPAWTIYANEKKIGSAVCAVGGGYVFSLINGGPTSVCQRVRTLKEVKERVQQLTDKFHWVIEFAPKSFGSLAEATQYLHALGINNMARTIVGKQSDIKVGEDCRILVQLSKQVV